MGSLRARRMQKVLPITVETGCAAIFRRAWNKLCLLCTGKAKKIKVGVEGAGVWCKGVSSQLCQALARSFRQLTPVTFTPGN